MILLCLFAILERYDYYLHCAINLRGGSKEAWAGSMTLRLFRLEASC